jgi:2-oxoglutarate ferredoxin oxidoreductase subunit alpha
MSYAGKRVAIGSATGGFALMQEAFSCAGMAELPLVVAVSQRQGPATGLPTYSSQTDMRFVIHAGHGEFPRIVMAPGDPEESFYMALEALNLAWEYQLPVIVLMDKIISEHASTSLLKSDEIKVARGNVAEKTGEKYGRYEITKDGISPMAFPGTPNTVVKVTSYEHDAFGITVDEPEATKIMLNKRFKKSDTLNASLRDRETVKVYGDSSSKNVVVFWGSTKGPVLEAVRYLEKPIKLVQIVWLEPFDSKKVMEELSGAEKIIDVECNHDGQLDALIREKTGIVTTDTILKYDSRPFEPVKLAEEINKILGN